LEINNISVNQGFFRCDEVSCQIARKRSERQIIALNDRLTAIFMASGFRPLLGGHDGPCGLQNWITLHCKPSRGERRVCGKNYDSERRCLHH
jgi:hypothetical protein